MSQYLVAVYNKRPSSIFIWNSEDGDNKSTIQPGQILIIQNSVGHWNIPDCSGTQYFAGHHIEIRESEAGETLFSFWDDDQSNYILQMCPGIQYDQLKPIPGANDLGNFANVMIQVEEGLLAAPALMGKS